MEFHFVKHDVCRKRWEAKRGIPLKKEGKKRGNLIPGKRGNRGKIGKYWNSPLSQNGGAGEGDL